MSRSQNNVQEKIKHATNFNNVLKYKVLTGMTIVFTVVILGILATSLYLTHQSSILRGQLSALNQSVAAFHIVNYDLYRLKYNEGNDPGGPYLATIIDDLRSHEELFNNLLNVLKEGGEIKDEKGNRIRVARLDDNPDNREVSDLIRSAEANWLQMDRFIGNYLSNAQNIKADHSELEHAIVRSTTLSKKIETDLISSAVDVDRRLGKYSDLSNVLQYIGIAFASIYFLFFFWYTIYRLETSSDETELLNLENQKILDTVREGLFLMDNKMTIRPNYSKELERIVGRSHLGGMNFIEVIRNMVSNSDILLVESFIDQLFSNRANERLIDSLNPLSKVAIPDEVKKDEIARYLRFSFNRVVRGKKIISLLVCVEDITQQIKMEEKLAQERETFEQKLDVITSMIHMDKTRLKNIMVVTKQSILKINEILKHPGKTKQDFNNKIRAINMVVTELETKARQVRFDEIVKNCSELSQDLVELNRSQRLVGDNFLSITISLDKLLNLLLTIDDLCLKTGIFENTRPRRSDDLLYGPQPLSNTRPTPPLPHAGGGGGGAKQGERGQGPAGPGGQMAQGGGRAAPGGASGGSAPRGQGQGPAGGDGGDPQGGA